MKDKKTLTEREIKEIYGSRQAYEQHQQYARQTDAIELQRDATRKANMWQQINLLTFGCIPRLVIGGVLLGFLSLIAAMLSLFKC